MVVLDITFGFLCKYVYYELGMRMTHLITFRSGRFHIRDSHQHNFSETPVFAGCGVRAVGTNESNT